MSMTHTETAQAPGLNAPVLSIILARTRAQHKTVAFLMCLATLASRPFWQSISFQRLYSPPTPHALPWSLVTDDNYMHAAWPLI